MISYNTINVNMPPIKRRNNTAWVRRVAATYGKEVGEIAYIFCDDEKILEVNQQYLNHDYYTDIITFDYTEGNVLNGDLFISLDTVRTNAEQRQISYREELDRVIIHGILHLCGINDKGPGERQLMEAAENKALNLREADSTRFFKTDYYAFDPSSKEGRHKKHKPRSAHLTGIYTFLYTTFYSFNPSYFNFVFFLSSNLFILPNTGKFSGITPPMSSIVCLTFFPTS